MRSHQEDRAAGFYNLLTKTLQNGRFHDECVSGLCVSFPEEGFRDEVGEMRLVRSEELLERWLRASHSRMHETPARWILSGEKDTFHAALRSYASRMRSSAPLSLFKFVHGTEPHLDDRAARSEGSRGTRLSLKLQTIMQMYS